MGFHIWSWIRNRTGCWIGSKTESDLPKMECRTIWNTQCSSLFRREVTITVEDPLLGYTKEFHCQQVELLSWPPTFLATHVHLLSNVQRVPSFPFLKLITQDFLVRRMGYFRWSNCSCWPPFLQQTVSSLISYSSWHVSILSWTEVNAVGHGLTL